MNENQAIESRMVTRRIQSAAQKIESQATSDLAADSAEEWLVVFSPHAAKSAIFTRGNGRRVEATLGQTIEWLTSWKNEIQKEHPDVLF
jgi:hypothetical protein